MTDTAFAQSLILTKLQKPLVGREFVQRPRLLEQLAAPTNLTLVIAPAGYGKSTLLSAWLDACDLPHAWLSLDEADSDLTVFVSYLITAVRTLFPTAGDDTLALIHGETAPPVTVISRSVLNALAAIEREYILILDDYHVIRERAIHELLTDLVRHPPGTLHLVLAARSDPPLPLVSLRACAHVTELRAADLCFTLEEAARFLREGMQLQVDEQAVSALRTRTEGWAVGLRLAALYLRHTGDLASILVEQAGHSRYIMDYLAAEVLKRLAPATQEFLMKTSILDRFCAPLCQAVIGLPEPEPDAQAILESLHQAGLFLLPLDETQYWYRYHRLFQQLLQYQLRLSKSPAEVAALHVQASAWLAENGFPEAALQHALAAGDTGTAVQVFTQYRRILMDEEDWQRLDRWIRMFPRQIVDQQPELLLAEVWVLLNRHRLAAVPPLLDRVETLLAQLPLDAATASRLEGELAIRRGTQYFYDGDEAHSWTAAKEALQKIPPEWQQLRAQARLFSSVGYLMAGDLAGAYATLYGPDGVDLGRAFEIRMFAIACFAHWMAADLPRMEESATQALALGGKSNQSESISGARHFVGIFHYERNDLATAEQYLLPLVWQPYRAHAMIFLNSAVAQALIYQARDQPDEAREVADVMSAFSLEARSANILFVAQAFRAELALRQGRLAEARAWAQQVEFKPAPLGWFYAPPMTLVRILLAQDTPASRERAGQVLDQWHDYLTATHQTRWLIEVLALWALLHQAEGREGEAHAALKQALDLAEPGGFIRAFVDLGAGLERLLAALVRERDGTPYALQVLAAFHEAASPELLRSQANESLLSPLTRRELEVLALLDQRYSDREIAEKLVISLPTVRSHIDNIGDKLGVHGRRAIVQAARDLRLL